LESNFNNRVLVLGAGSVAQCVVPLLIEHLVKANQITIVDQRDTKSRFTSPISQGAKYINDQLTQENMDAFLSKYLTAGDFLLDLAWNIYANDIIEWAHNHGVLYLNTSLELWDPNSNPSARTPQERTLYYRHMKLRELTSAWKGQGPTAIVEHGANPGLVSHLVKKALVDIATRAIKDGLAAAGVEESLASDNYPTLAHLLGVKVIHIAERDTQISDKPKLFNEFVNTWSVEGFYEEGIAPAELGWGTHEKTLPAKAFTVHYAYCPSDAAIASMRELEMMQWNITENQRIMNDEIIDGEDRLGVLLMGHMYKSWWTGSLLSIHDARKLIPGQSATTVQVGSAVFAAVAWAMKNPSRGFMVPDDMPWREVLPFAEKYWGGFHSQSSDWDPLQTRNDLFKGWNGRVYDESDPWQFSNFLA